MPSAVATPGSLVIRLVSAVGPKATGGNTTVVSGSTVRYGDGPPASTLGIDGDSYIDKLNGDLYAKAAGAYSVVGNVATSPSLTGVDGGTPDTSYSYTPIDGGGP